MSAPRLPFTIAGHSLGAFDKAIILADENPRTVLIETTWQNIAIDVEITVGEVTMHAAAWEDPDHWVEDWREVLGLDPDDDPTSAVDDLLAAALEVEPVAVAPEHLAAGAEWQGKGAASRQRIRVLGFEGADPADPQPTDVVIGERTAGAEESALHQPLRIAFDQLAAAFEPSKGAVHEPRAEA